jgi:hypothetical protein
VLANPTDAQGNSVENLMTVNLSNGKIVGDCEGEINVYIACNLRANDTFVMVRLLQGASSGRPSLDWTTQ